MTLAPKILHVPKLVHGHYSTTLIPFSPIIHLTNTYLPGGGWFIICACCSANRWPIRSLLTINFDTQRLMQPVSLDTRDFVVKSSTQWSKHFSTRLENIYRCEPSVSGRLLMGNDSKRDWYSGCHKAHDINIEMVMWTKTGTKKMDAMTNPHELFHLFSIHSRLQLALLCSRKAREVVSNLDVPSRLLGLLVPIHFEGLKLGVRRIGCLWSNEVVLSFRNYLSSKRCSGVK